MAEKTSFFELQRLRGRMDHTVVLMPKKTRFGGKLPVAWRCAVKSHVDYQGSEGLDK